MFVSRSDCGFGSYMIRELETTCLMGVGYVPNVLGKVREVEHDRNRFVLEIESSFSWLGGRAAEASIEVEI